MFSASAGRSGFGRQLLRNLLAGLRIFGLRRVGPSDFTSTFDQVAALFVLSLLIAAGFDWLRAEPDWEFTYYGFYTWGFCLLGGFWACAIAARVQSPLADTRSFLTALLSVSPYVIVVVCLLYQFSFAANHPTLTTGVALGIVLAMSLAALQAAHGFVRLGACAIVAVAVVGLPWAVDRLDLYPGFWVAQDSAQDPDTISADWQAAESILFDEPGRIEDAVEQMAPERPGVSDVFFLGFAGYGGQRVFRNEALFAARTFAARFGSGSRSVQLINDARDRESYPLATVSGLDYALSLIGEHMDVQDDVLVLFLTSHGSREEGIAVTNGSLPLNSLEPQDLRESLDNAGIKWRVIIVSACYAGVFLEPLQSANTLIITAADADHTSFGCADDRDLTYFGEAFLRDALPGAPSLEAAFKKASSLIVARENAEKLTHSNPQIYMGSAIREKLATVARMTAAPGLQVRSDLPYRRPLQSRVCNSAW